MNENVIFSFYFLITTINMINTVLSKVAIFIGLFAAGPVSVSHTIAPFINTSKHLV